MKATAEHGPIALDPHPGTEGHPAGSSGGGDAEAAPGPGSALEWGFNPWQERPVASVVALGLTIGSAILLGTLGVAPLGCILLGLTVGFSFAPLLIPARCRIDEQGVAQRGPLGWERRRWDTIRRATRVRGGLLVSPFAHPRRLDSYRALLLPMPRAHRQALTALAAPRFARHGLEPLA